MLFGRSLKKHLPTRKPKDRYRVKTPRTFSLETILKVVRPLPGEWESVLSGKGQQFSQFKEFRPPDDPSLIHVPTLAQTGEAYITERIPRRGVEVTLIVDFSSSCDTPVSSAIRDTAAFLLGASAAEKESPLAVACFSEEVEYFLPFDDPRTQLKRFDAWIVKRDKELGGQTKKTSFRSLVPYVVNRVPEKSLVFLISDFLSREGLEEVLNAMRGRVDCTPVYIDSSKIWSDLPLGFYEVRASDIEEGEEASLFLTPYKIQEIRAFHRKRREEFSLLCKRYGFSSVVLETPDVKTCMNAFTKCFRQKSQKRS